MTVVTKKIKVSVVADTPEERTAGYREIRRQADINRKLKNLMMTHLWAEQTYKDNFVNFQNDSVQKIEKKIVKAVEKIGKLNAKLDKAKKKKNEELVLTVNEELVVARKEQEELASEKTKIRNLAYKEAEKALTDFALGLNEGKRIYRIQTGDEDVWSNTILSARQEIVAKFEDSINEVKKGSQNLVSYRNGDIYVRSNSDISKTKIYQEGNNILLKTTRVPLLKLNMDARRQNGRELRKTIERCVDGEYRFLDSKLKFYDNDLFLLATIEIPDKENYLDPNTVVGVDLGIAIPAYCGLNNDEYQKKSIGSAKDFLHVRTQMQNRRRALQKSMTLVSGGKGRDVKLRKLDKMKQSERNFAQTFNHQVSKQIVDFALKNKAGMVRVEDLHFDTKENNRLLRNWSYYELQTMIEYKAKKEGILFEKVNPRLTSQTCSFCGHYEEGQRTKQDTFYCKNTECKKGKGYKGFGVNADWNASRNIAKNINEK